MPLNEPMESEENFPGQKDDNNTPVISKGRPGKHVGDGTGSSSTKINFITSELASSLDRAGVSDRNATMILGATVKTLGLDLDKYAVNRTSIRCARLQQREKMAKILRSNLTLPEKKITLHCDGKLMRDLTGKDRVDRLPVLVTGHEWSQLLGVPKLESGTGIEQANAISSLVLEWDLKKKICAFNFDTPNVNVGRLTGTCVTLETLLEEQFLHLSCRHHILELLLEAVFLQSYGPSSGPWILLFKRFQTSWKDLGHSNVVTLKNRPEAWETYSTYISEIAVLAEEQIKCYQPRDDYRELLELVLIFIAEKDSAAFTIKAPGAYNQCRWMAKAIYSLKIWLFQEEFELSKRDEKGLLYVCLFVTFVYIQSWYTAPCAISAPRNYLELAQGLIARLEENPVFAAATKKLSRHLWYLGEKLVGLAFFDPAVPHSEKRKMVTAIKECQSTDFTKRFEIADFNDLKSKSLHHFVTVSTKIFFERLGVETDFLESNPQEWENLNSFKEGLDAAKNLTVVNDHAERAVALAQSYNRLLTKDGDQYQFLLQCVEYHRKMIPDVKKSTLLQSNLAL